MAKVLPGTAINKAEGLTKDLTPVKETKVEFAVSPTLAVRLWSLAFDGFKEEDFLPDKLPGELRGLKDLTSVAVSVSDGLQGIIVLLAKYPNQPGRFIVAFDKRFIEGDIMIADSLGPIKMGTVVAAKEDYWLIDEERQAEAQAIFDEIQALEPIPPEAEEKPADQPAAEAEVKPEEKPEK